jgi:hypothetical protein
MDDSEFAQVMRVGLVMSALLFFAVGFIFGVLLG